jgi:hypothetical protein
VHRTGAGAALVAALGGLLAAGGCGGERARAPVADARREVDPEVARGGSGVTASGPPATIQGGAAGPARGLAEASGPEDGPGGPIEVEEPPPGRGEEAVLAAAEALPAWSAVLARGRLLDRRGERGAAWGRVVAGPWHTAWLMDETEAGAGLGIALAGAGGRKLEVKPGARVVAWGAWAAEGEAQKRWVWRVDRLVGLPPAKAGSAAPGAGSAASGSAASGSAASGSAASGSAASGSAASGSAASGSAASGSAASAPALLPSARIGELAAPPADALPPSQRVQSGMLLFIVVAAPAKPGDGWSVADAPKQPAAALLVLPGEAAVYGGLDYLAPEERWALQPGAWYAVPVTAPSKPPRDGALPVLRAQAAPSRVPPPPAPPARKR